MGVGGVSTKDIAGQRPSASLPAKPRTSLAGDVPSDPVYAPTKPPTSQCPPCAAGPAAVGAHVSRGPRALGASASATWLWLMARAGATLGSWVAGKEASCDCTQVKKPR